MEKFKIMKDEISPKELEKEIIQEITKILQEKIQKAKKDDVPSTSIELDYLLRNLTEWEQGKLTEKSKRFKLTRPELIELLIKTIKSLNIEIVRLTIKVK